MIWLQKEREAFEAWYRKEYDNTVIDDSEFSEILDEYESNYYWVDELNQSWKAWQAAKAQAVPEGFVLVNAESLSLHAQSIRMFSNGNEENYYYEIENHVCAIEAMIEAQEPAND